MNILNKVKNVFKKNNKEKTTEKPFSNVINSSLFNFSSKSKKKFNEIYNKNKESFDQIASPNIILEQEDVIQAKVTLESYVDMLERKKQIGDFKLDTKLSTQNTCIYYNDIQKICIIWYRWTVVTDMKDISSDVQIVLDIQSTDPRVKNALEIYDTIKREYQWYQIRVCGHSLWWTLSYIVSKHRNTSRCTVFNPWVSLNTLFIQMLKDTYRKTERTKNTYTYKILWDLISTLAFVWNTKVFRIWAKDPLKLHAVMNFEQIEELLN